MNFIFDPSLVLYLPLYQLDGASFVSKDAYGHSCIVTGALWRPKGRYFDGIDDKITIPHHAALTITDNLTLIVWVRVEGQLSNDATIILKGASFAAGSTYQLFFRGTQVRFGSDFGAGRDSVNMGIDYLGYYNVWMCLGIIYVDPTVSCYFQGAFKRAEDHAGGLGSDTVGLTLGQEGANAREITGDIGEVQIYNRALTPLEIQHNYLATKWRYR